MSWHYPNQRLFFTSLHSIPVGVGMEQIKRETLCTFLALLIRSHVISEYGHEACQLRKRHFLLGNITFCNDSGETLVYFVRFVSPQSPSSQNASLCSSISLFHRRDWAAFFVQFNSRIPRGFAVPAFIFNHRKLWMGERESYRVKFA